MFFFGLGLFIAGMVSMPISLAQSNHDLAQIGVVITVLGIVFMVTHWLREE